MTELDWKRLGAHVVRRRNELGYRSQAAFEEVAGTVSYRTLSRLENGNSVSKNTLRTVERVLGWRTGSTDAILRGGEAVIDRAEARGGAAPRWQSYRVTADECLNLLEVALKDYGPGGFWRAFDDIVAGREEPSIESPIEHGAHSA